MYVTAVRPNCTIHILYILTDLTARYFKTCHWRCQLWGTGACAPPRLPTV